MKMKSLLRILPICLLAGCAASGDRAAAPAAEAPRVVESGEVTRQWLERQRQGQQAAAKPQTLSGPVQEQIYERYQKSFTHPIPERFESERLNTSATAR